MFAGAYKVDITPEGSVWMEGMLREGKSQGVHDKLYARALVMSNDSSVDNAYAIVAVDVCVIKYEYINKVKAAVNKKCGIKPDNIIISASHTHSGPSTEGVLQEFEAEYVEKLMVYIAEAIDGAVKLMKPALIGCGNGREETISNYRRFLDENGKVVMIWEQNPAENNFKVLGDDDPSLGVLKVVESDNPKNTICVLFNHAGHPNVMSGDNYLISADYPGVSQRLVEEKYNCVGMFINGAQGSVDIDNWKYRDWDGMEIIGKAVADAAIETAEKIEPLAFEAIKWASVNYTLPSRKITDEEYKWAQDILKVTGGTITPMPDGVGDDYKALLYDKLRKAQDKDIAFEQACFAIGDTAFISAGCELFTEVGMKIKAKSPFKYTYILGLSNGCFGYIPSKDAIKQGGYEVDTRCADESAEDIVIERSVKLLETVYNSK